MQTQIEDQQAAHRPTLRSSIRAHDLFPHSILLAIACTFLLIGALLPLRGLLFNTALLNRLAPWVLIPTHLLFPRWQLNSILTSNSTLYPTLSTSWQETALLFVVFLLLLLFYLLALRYLPGRITRRYIFFSTLLLGSICVLFPMLTSPDLFSYIFYARAGVLYHLNPLTVLPKTMPGDPTYSSIYWTNQPSAYGPTWAAITCALQWLLARPDSTGLDNVAWMVLALRLLGLLAHLCSTLLVWSICGHLQRRQDMATRRTRLQATLAFAWNPLLLFEACVNAHNDTLVLLFVLLGIWFLVRKDSVKPSIAFYMALMLAFGTCLKINIALFIPGILLFFCCQPRRLHITSTFLITYIGTIVLLYLPFWQNGAILNLLHVNPSTQRNINSLAEFLTFFYSSLARLAGAAPAVSSGLSGENSLHTASLAIFAAGYCILCWQMYTRHRLQTPLQLLRWMAVAWLLYCAIGAPWFWPWYTVTFFGLFALIEAVDTETWHKQASYAVSSIPQAVRLLAFSMLSLYCFYTWAAYNSTLFLLPGFRWAYWRGLWIWLLPLLALLLRARSRFTKPVTTR